MKKKSFQKNYSKLTAKEIVNFSNTYHKDDVATETSYVAPRNDVEYKLKAIFELVLTRENIGVHDKFFRIGGNSLKATQLISQIYKQFNVELNLTEVFDSSTIEALTTLISDKKQSNTSLEIKPVTEQDSYALSSSQYRMWLLCQIQNVNLAYNMSGSIVFEKGFDKDAFTKAIIAVVKRHESLRTIFKEDNNEVRQFIVKYEALDFAMEEYDLRDQPLSDEALEKTLYEQSRKPFDFAKAPLFRAILLQLPDDKWCFLLVIHHIISDGWSMNVIREELAKYYQAYKAQITIDIPKLKIQYKDYAAWQQNHLDSEKYKAHKSFWLSKLSEEIEVIDLPSSKTRPTVLTQNGNEFSTYITPEQTRLLRAYCQKKDASIYMGVLTVFNILLFRYTSQKDIVLGTPVAGRNHVDLEEQIGLYVNTLILRNKIDPNANFDAVFDQINRETLKSYDHQEYPFDQLIEDLSLQRNTSRNPIFDVMLSYQKMNQTGALTEPDSTALHKIVDKGICYSKLDVEVIFQDKEKYLQFAIKYNTDVYDRSMIKGLMKHYKELLSKLLENPNQSIAAVDYVQEKEKHKILTVFNTPTIDTNTPISNTVIGLFQQQIDASPNNVALVFGDEVLTYQELDTLSNQFAHYLIATHDITAKDLVAIKLEMSNWLVVALLGILKSGSAYLPLHAEYPKDRVAFMKQDSNYRLLVDQEVWSNFLLEKDQLPKKSVEVDISEEDLAYVIYTSGTTGNPKGVMITHANLASFVTSVPDRFKLSAIKKMAVATNLTFDISVLEIFGSLCLGKELHVFSNEEINNPEKYMKRLHDSCIDGVQLTPSRLTQLYHLDTKFQDSLQVMLVGGEALSENLYQKLKKEPFESINVYGPTETTIWSSSLNIKESDHVTIGSPLPNEQIYIIDTHNNLLTEGLIGEICIGGKGVAKGYLNRPELTAQKFIKSPFSPNERIYKTGDLGKWLPDGKIAFEGRGDDQVKIRGHRIELGEIESILLTHEEIDEALIMAKDTDADSMSLVAYFVSKEELKASDLRTYLMNFLPKYMVPDYFVRLDTFPLNTNGKVDKRAFPSPNIHELKRETNYVAPTNEIEEKLVKIWEYILGKEKIGVKDDFFELGGNSIKVMTLSSAIREEFGVNLGFEQLIQEPKIEVLAEDIKLMQWNNSEDSSEETIEIQI